MASKKTPESVDESKRDFLTLTTGAVACTGAAAAAWPLIDSIRPAADVRALATTEVNVGNLTAGQAMTVMWRGKPVFIKRRTPEEIAEARAVDVASLPDPQTDEERVQKDEFLVMIGVCTHLGCVPSGQQPTHAKGNFNGWFCPCHGSHYDSSGRIRLGPAPRNLEIPPYEFIDETVIRIG